MSYEVNSREYELVSNLEASKRYSYFIKKVCDWGQIWTVRNNNGFVLLGDLNEKECFPVWPAKCYSQGLCCGDWQDCYPVVINIHDWFKKWITGLIRDGRLVAVFPTPSLESINVEPQRLLKDMEFELENIR